MSRISYYSLQCHAQCFISIKDYIEFISKTDLSSYLIWITYIPYDNNSFNFDVRKRIVSIPYLAGEFRDSRNKILLTLKNLDNL